MGDYLTVMSFQTIFLPRQYYLLTVTVSVFRATVIGDKKMAKGVDTFSESNRHMDDQLRPIKT